jgi:hypothetical protein
MVLPGVLYGNETWDKMDRTCSMCGGYEKAYKILVGKPEETRPLMRPRHKWKYNIKLKETARICGLDACDLGNSSRVL